MAELNAMSAARVAALQRSANASLRAAGGVEVQLRCAGLAHAGASATAIELGLAAYAADDVALAPAVVAPQKTTDPQHLAYEVLISATAVEQAMEARSETSASEFFRNAIGVVVQGRLLRIESFTAELAAGVPILYRVMATE